MLFLRDFSLTGKERGGKKCRILESITCRPWECWIFFPYGTEGLRAHFPLYDVGWAFCISEEYCVGIMLFLMQNSTHSALTEDFSVLLYIVTMVANNLKLGLFQTVERWPLGPDRFTIAFKSHKWHRLLYGVYKSRQLNNSYPSPIWKPEPPIDSPVSDWTDPGGDQRGN